MGVKTKAELAALFETGDKPSQQDFQDVFDTMVAVPSGASLPAIIEVESTASSTSRGLGALGTQLLGATTTAQAQGILDIPEFSSLAISLVSAMTTAAVQALLSLNNVNVDFISGQIETPASANYILDQSAAFPYSIEWIAVQVSGGTVNITAQIDGTNVTGIVSAAQTTAESISSAGGANAVALGNTVRLVSTGGSSPSNLSFTMKVVRT